MSGPRGQAGRQERERRKRAKRRSRRGWQTAGAPATHKSADILEGCSILHPGSGFPALHVFAAGTDVAGQNCIAVAVTLGPGCSVSLIQSSRGASPGNAPFVRLVPLGCLCERPLCTVRWPQCCVTRARCARWPRGKTRLCEWDRCWHATGSKRAAEPPVPLHGKNKPARHLRHSVIAGAHVRTALAASVKGDTPVDDSD